MSDLLSSVVLLGFFLGMRHATDPDHVIAVGTIVSRAATVRSAALVGLLWGLGHSLTILVVGGAIVLFGLVIPPRIGLGMELSVAFMLIALGLGTIFGRVHGRAAADPPDRHSHPHTHGDYVHAHPHGHGPGTHGHSEDATPLGRLDRVFGGVGLYLLVRPFVVGVVHGLAGTAAFTLLVTAAIPHAGLALAYLMVFGIGTVAGMMLVTAATAMPLVYARQRVGDLHHRLGLAAGTLSVAFGLFMVYRIAPTF